jgi:tRNA uridine 5-carbamoylmethylation protein Kti12
MNPKVIVLIGVPCSGKSTFLSNGGNNDIDLNDFDTRILSSDNYIETVAARASKTYSEVFEDAIETAEKLFWNDLDQAVAGRYTIVVDRTNLTKKARKRLLDKIPSDYEKIAIWFETPPKHTLGERNVSRPGKKIPPYVLESMMKRLEPPAVAEGWDRMITVRSWE